MARGIRNRFTQEDINITNVNYTSTISGRLIDTTVNIPVKGTIYIIDDKNTILHKFDTDESGNFQKTLLLNGSLNTTDPIYTNLKIVFSAPFYISYTRYIFYYNPDDYPGYSTQELNDNNLGEIFMYLTENASDTTINNTGPGGVSLDAKINIDDLKEGRNQSTNENITQTDNEYNESNTIKIESDDYTVIEVNPYEKGGTVRKDLDIIKLDDGEANIDAELLKIKYPDIHLKEIDQYKAIKKIVDQSRGIENKKAIVREALKQNLKRKMIPLIIKDMLVPFGITTFLPIIMNKVSSMEQFAKDDNFSCPTELEMKRIIKRKNRIAKALNIIYVSLNAATVAVGVNQGLLKLIKPSIKAKIVAPSAIYGGPVPQPDIPTKVSVKKADELEDKSSKLEKLNENLLLFLTSVTFLLGIILKLLKATDESLELCGTDVQKGILNEELFKFNEEFDNELNNKINGFILEVESEKTENSLKRKRAIAKNEQGVILLRGEYSYASSDQILIEELKFYIQQNDLKAE